LWPKCGKGKTNKGEREGQKHKNGCILDGNVFFFVGKLKNGLDGHGREEQMNEGDLKKAFFSKNGKREILEK
jgi:hypothetical protein